MRYVVTYDISDDRVRARVSKTLENYGTRVQESVFECPITDKEVEGLVTRLKRELASPENGSIRFYRLCADCMKASFGMGVPRALTDLGPCIVV